jgi:hypothetical protein
MTMPRAKFSAVALLLFTLSACASPTPARVSSVPAYQPPPKPQVVKHVVRPKLEKDQPAPAIPAEAAVAQVAPQPSATADLNAGE